MGLSGLDFMTVAANFLDSYSRTRRADLDFKRDAGRQDQLISAERQYQSGVREGERAFQSQQAQSARDFQRSESDREWGRGGDARALQEQLQRQQLGMTQAQFEEWKLSAPGRRKMEELDIKAKEAQINQANAQTAHYGRMGTGGDGISGGGRAGNPNAITPGERWQDDLDRKAAMLLRQMKMEGPDGERLPEEEIQAKVDLAYRMAKGTMPPQPGGDGVVQTVEGPPPPPPNTPMKYERSIADPGSKDYRPDFVARAESRINEQMGDYNRSMAPGVAGAAASNPALGLAAGIAARVSGRPLRKALRGAARLDPIKNIDFNPAAEDTLLFPRK